MTLDQAIETLANSADEQQRCSAITVIALQCEAAAIALVRARAEDGKVGRYAELGLTKIHERTK